MGRDAPVISDEDIAVVDYIRDEFRLLNGDCYVSGEPHCRPRAIWHGRPYRRVPLRDTGGEALRHTEFWVAMKNDPKFRKRIEAACRTPVPLPYSLPTAFGERDCTEVEKQSGQFGEYAYPYPNRARCKIDDLPDSIGVAQAWVQTTIDKAIAAASVGASEIVWRIRPESDIQICGDGRLQVKAYMRFAVL